jgi:hypothetical protein
MDYTTLSIVEVTAGLEDAARQAQETFGRLNVTQLNWRPDATRWSVAQCLEHLVTANQQMQHAAQDALGGTAGRNLWTRLPVWPAVMGRMLVRSQAPQTTRKFKAPSVAQPSSSDIPADIVQRFVEQHRALVAWVRVLDEQRAMGVIMTSPFVRVVTYSVLDGCRLILAHDHRHLQQAGRVLREPASI